MLISSAWLNLHAGKVPTSVKVKPAGFRLRPFRCRDRPLDRIRASPDCVGELGKLSLSPRQGKMDDSTLIIHPPPCPYCERLNTIDTVEWKSGAIYYCPDCRRTFVNRK